MFLRLSLALAVTLALLTCTVQAEDMASGIVKYFAGKREYKSADGTQQGSVDWRAVAGGKAIGGPGKSTSGGAAFALAGWDPDKKIWFHHWFGEDGQHGRLEITRFEHSTFYGEVRVVEGDGETVSAKWENKVVDHDHFVITERAEEEVTVIHWHRVK